MALAVYAAGYGAGCLYVVVQAIRGKVSRAEVVIFGVASLVIPAYFFFGRS
jgi:hypothetical protein